MSDLEQIEVSIEELEECSKMAVMLSNLASNPDFIALVLNGYLREEAVELVINKGLFKNQNPEDQARITTAIDGIGSFSRYLSGIHNLGNEAKSKLAEHYAAREEIIQEDA